MEGDNVFLSIMDCRRLFVEKEIFIFGTGVDAEKAAMALSEDIFITAYVDNHRYGQGNFFCGKDIISLEHCLQRRNKKQPILIATYRFAMEIFNQLTEADLQPGKDFYIWDDMHLFHADSATKNYINFLTDVWKVDKKRNPARKILLPFDNIHDLQSTVYAYCGNYFAEKYDAAMYGFFRAGSKRANASEIMIKIYQAFNVESIIDDKLNDGQLKEAEEICESLWENLSTWEDWNRITIYGIHFGTTIVRTFLRFYIPTFDLKDEKMYQFLKKNVQTIVFWYHYIMENDVKVVLLADGVTWEGYIRDIAITKKIPTYVLGYMMKKAFLNFYVRSFCPYFKKMWNQLTSKEQEYGIKWAKEHLQNRIQGGKEEILHVNKEDFPFAERKTEARILDVNDKCKILICPHIFEEDSYSCGEQIFDNNYFAWLCHLGELSEKTPDYDWYLKMHPKAKRRDMIIIDMLLKKYPKIKKIPSKVSPHQLKEEGIGFALTVCGTIGHEYPEIGIQVINAGINPHSAFDFNWNPKTKEEYDELIMNLPKLDKKINKEELYQFYSLNYLFYNLEYIPYRTLFFKNSILAMHSAELQAIGKKMGTWKYEEYMKEWSRERHEEIRQQMESVFRKIDEWRPDVLYKREVKVEE